MTTLAQAALAVSTGPWLQVQATSQRTNNGCQAMLNGCSPVQAARGLRLTVSSRPVAKGRRAAPLRVARIVSEKAQEAVAGAGVVTDATFRELVLDSSIPVLVDFWAPWCGPCRMIAPLIDELSKQYAGKLRCLKLNTDESPGVATEYGIRSIPTVMIFKDGKKMDTVIGAVPKSTLTTTIEKFLNQ